jgi:hypothetical protein
LPGKGGLASAEVYDPVTDRWIAADNMAAGRSFHTATLLTSGKVLVAGGIDATGQGAVGPAELFDNATGTWSQAGVPGARHGHTATLLEDGRVLVAGGFAPWPVGLVGSTVLYDPASNTWETRRGLTDPRAFHTATRLLDANVLVAGRVGALGGAEVYRYASDNWLPAGLIGTRGLHTATLLSSGNVLVVGGGDGGVSAFRSAELYDPSTNTWSAAPALVTGRLSHTATLLDTGDLLVVGGYATSSDDTPLSTAEIFRETIVDRDADGVCDPGATSPLCVGSDACADTPDAQRPVDANGCSQLEIDGDLDGVCDPGKVSTLCSGSDSCPSTTPGGLADINGCAQYQVDADLDGVCDDGASSTFCSKSDECHATPYLQPVDSWGCTQRQYEARLADKFSPALRLAADDYEPEEVEIFFDDPARTNCSTELRRHQGNARDYLVDLCPGGDDLYSFNSAIYYLDLTEAPVSDEEKHRQKYILLAPTYRTVTYADVLLGSDFVVVDYWLFYYYNDFYVLDHEGDFERVQVRATSRQVV